MSWLRRTALSAEQKAVGDALAAIAKATKHNSEIWWEVFKACLYDFEIADMSSDAIPKAAKRAGELADCAIEEFEKRWPGVE